MTDMTDIEIRTQGRILMGPGPSNVHPRVLRRFQRRLSATSIRNSGDNERNQGPVVDIYDVKRAYHSDIGDGKRRYETSLVNFIEPGNKC